MERWNGEMVEWLFSHPFLFACLSTIILWLRFAILFFNQIVCFCVVVVVVLILV